MAQISEGGEDSKGLFFSFFFSGPQCHKKWFNMFAEVASPVQLYQRQYGSWTKLTRTHMENQVEAHQVKAI